MSKVILHVARRPRNRSNLSLRFKNITLFLQNWSKMETTREIEVLKKKKNGDKEITGLSNAIFDVILARVRVSV